MPAALDAFARPGIGAHPVGVRRAIGEIEEEAPAARCRHLGAAMDDIGAIYQERAARTDGAHRGVLPFLKALLRDARLREGELHDGYILGQLTAHDARRAMRRRHIAQIEEHLDLAVTSAGARR